jgi:hypothetical protein
LWNFIGFNAARRRSRWKLARRYPPDGHELLSWSTGIVAISLPLARFTARWFLWSRNLRRANVRLHHQLQVVLAGRNLVQLAAAWRGDSHLVDGWLTTHLAVADTELTRCVGHPNRLNPLPAGRAA